MPRGVFNSGLQEDIQKEITRHAETDLFFKGTVLEVFNTCTENEEDVEAGISKYISFCIMTLKSAILILKGFFRPLWERLHISRNSGKENCNRGKRLYVNI